MIPQMDSFSQAIASIDLAGSDDAKDEAVAAPRERQLAEPLRTVGLLEPAHQDSLQLVFFIAFKLDSPSSLRR